MIQKGKYIVYDKETDTLKLNAVESLLVTELMRNPPINYEMILANYYNESENKVEFIERLNEIFLFYWNAPRNNPVTPFTYNMKGLEFLIGLLNNLKNSKTKALKQKKVIIDKMSLEDFFTNIKEKQYNAILFRKEVIEKMLKQKGNLKPGAKRTLNTVVHYLIDTGVWKRDIPLINLSDTLRKECSFPKLNSQYFQSDRKHLPTPAFEKELKTIKWS